MTIDDPSFVSQEGQLDDLLPGLKRALTFGEKVTVVKQLVARHVMVVKQIDKDARDWASAENPQDIDFEKLHDAVDYLHVTLTHLKNTYQWAGLHETLAINPAILQDSQKLQKTVTDARETMFQTLLQLHRVVNREGMGEYLPPPLQRSYDALYDRWMDGGKQDQKVFDSPIQFTREIGHPYSDFLRFRNADGGGEFATESERDWLAESLTKNALEGWTKFAQADGFSTDLLKNYEAVAGVPAQVMRDYAQSEYGGAVENLHLSDGPGVLRWSEVESALRHVYAQFPGGSALLEAALREGWVHNRKETQIPHKGFARQALNSLKDWTGSHSFIYMPFDGSMFSALATAHELGHALQQEQTQLYHNNANLVNQSLSETFAMVMERLMGEALLEAVTEPARRKLLVNALEAREVRLTNGVARDTQFAMAVLEAVTDGRTAPLSAKELDGIAKAVCKESEDVTEWQNAARFYMGNYGLHAAHAHGIAALAARDWADRYLSLPEPERKAMAVEWVEVMKEAPRYEHEMAGALARVGVNMHDADFVKRTTEYPQRLQNRMSEEVRPVQGRFTAAEKQRETGRATAQALGA